LLQTCYLSITAERQRPASVSRVASPFPNPA